MTEHHKLKSPLRTLRSAASLVEGGLIDAANQPEIEQVLQRYSLAITPYVAEIISTSDPTGGVARQYVPDTPENSVTTDELIDPIGDHPHSPVKGIVHRHSDRVLLNLLHNCAVYCRFCFRREQVGPSVKALTDRETDAALAYIREHSEIWEVILSGGDPLLLPTEKISFIASVLNEIQHVGVLRFHTRLPAVDPDRVSDELVDALSVMIPTYLVIHINHPDEITKDFKLACAKLIGSGIPLLSQTVLLKGINNDATTLTRLFRGLVQCRVKPYYLHHPDKAKGTSHFRLPINEGQELMRDLRRDISGLCQPTYVLDIPGGHGKVPIGPSYLEANSDKCETCCVQDPAGDYHQYTDSK